MRQPSALLLCCLGLVAAGCGDDEDDDGGASSAETTEQRTDAGTTGAAKADAAVEVRMENIQYVPKSVKISAGDTVKWTNTDSVTHTVTKQTGPGGEFDSKNLKVGATFEHTFDRAGEVTYICTIHPNQTGTVTVD